MEETKKVEKVDIMKAIKGNREIAKQERTEKRAAKKKTREEKKADKKPVGATIKLAASYVGVAAAAASAAVGIMKTMNAHSASAIPTIEVQLVPTEVSNVGAEAAVPAMGETA